MSKAKIQTIAVTEPPKIPTLSFGKRPSGFGGGPKGSGRGQFVPQTVRITQNKGGGGK